MNTTHATSKPKPIRTKTEELYSTYMYNVSDERRLAKVRVEGKSCCMLKGKAMAKKKTTGN